MNEASEAMVQQPVEQPIGGSKADYDAVIQRSFARTEAKWRQERGPSAEGVPYGYLLATDHFLAEPSNPSQALEYLKGDAFDQLDLRFALQTTLNYLELRNAEGKCNDDELKTLDNVKDLTGSDDPEKAISQIKSTIRSFLPQDDIESFLPDTTPEGVRKDNLGIKEIASLARLILRDDEHKAPEEMSEVHNNCVQLIKRSQEERLNIAENDRSRRTALTTVMEKLQNEDDTLTFFEGHDPMSQKVLYHFSQNPGLLVKAYLHDLDTGKPEIIQEGELIKKVAAVLGDHPEAEFLKRSAESVENRMRGLLTRLYDPKTDQYRLSVTEFINSEKELHKKLETLPDEPEPNPTPITPEPEIAVPLKMDSVEDVRKEIDLEKLAPGINNVVLEGVKKHLESGQVTYTHKQVEQLWDVDRHSRRQIHINGYVNPTVGRDHHPEYTPTEAIATVVFRDYDGLQVNNRLRNAIYDLIDRTIESQKQAIEPTSTSSQQSQSQVS